MTPKPRLIAWEITRDCNLNCIHCRAAADMGPHKGELDTKACIKLIDQIAEIARPIIILTGGEPLLRKDIFKIAEYGTHKGLKMVMAPNGTLITDAAAKKMAESGIQRISVSLDGADEKSHDRFRGVEGAFDGAIRGIEKAKQAGIEFQINTTVTKANLIQIPEILKLAGKLQAAAWHVFLLVPTGRGKYITDQEIDAVQYEDALNWLYEQRDRMQIKVTCAPHYYRITRQRAKAEGKKLNVETEGMNAAGGGCLGGTAFCFISHTGIVQPCGFLSLECGNIKKEHFAEIWQNSRHLKTLRDSSMLTGKCGKCEYKKVCRGCRARAYEATGDFMSQEPLCIYEPSSA